MTFGTITSDGTTQTITFERILAHPRNRVWAALTDPEQRAVWFFAGSLPLVSGDPVELVDSGEGVTGEVVRVVEGEVLELTWRSEDAADSVVRFELFDAAGGSRLALTHTIRTGNPENLMPGWHRIVVDDLPEFLETGSASPKPGRWAALREEHYLPLLAQR